MRASLLAWVVVASSAMGQITNTVVSTLTAPENSGFEACVLQDVDRDGRDDLVIAVAAYAAPRSRSLQVHLRPEGRETFRSTPDRTVRLTPDVTAFALLDLGARHGKDILLFNRSGAWVRVAVEGQRPTAKKVLEARLIWQLAEDSDVLHWGAGVRDLNGDGLDDLVIPEAGAWRLAFQERDAKGEASFGRAQVLRVPLDATITQGVSRVVAAQQSRTRRKNLELRVRGGAPDATSEPLLSVIESVPAPQLVDWDGDGDLDLLARTAEKLHVWVQNPGGSFPDTPTSSYPIPVVTDRERQFDISYSAHVADMNADRRADCVFFAGNRRSKDVKTQVLLYVQGSKGRGPAATTEKAPLFGPRGIPAQMLQLAGFVGFPRLEDINGDGRPDLSLTTFRPDLIDAMRSQSAKSLDIGWSIFINRNGRFGKRADLQSSLRLKAKDLDDAKELVLTRFFPDRTGDGIAEALVQDAPRRLRMIALSPARGGGVVRSEEPMWEYVWNFDGKVVLPARGSQWHPELVIRGDRKLLHLRLER